MFWRRRAPLLPLLVAPLIVVIAVTIAFYNPRYRAAAETSPVALAAIAIDVGTRRRGPMPPEVAPPVLA